MALGTSQADSFGNTPEAADGNGEAAATAGSDASIEPGTMGAGLPVDSGVGASPDAGHSAEASEPVDTEADTSPHAESDAAATAPGDTEAEAALDAQPESKVVLWYFWRDACPYCARADQWLDELEESRPGLEIKRVEVIRDAEGRALFVEMMKERGEQASGVPAFIIGDGIWIGFTQPLADDMEAEIEALLADRKREASGARSTIDLGPLGRIDVAGQPMVAATALIAFVDGFNPCSLWVLTVLLAMILGTRSRARIAAVGLTFLFVTASIYGVFIAGLFAAFVVAGQLGWIQVVVAILALLFGLVNVKDFFAFKQGLSFTIPDRFKPKIYRGGRALREDRPLAATLAITVALAAGVALIELPCTAGFPVVWTTLLSEAGVTGAAFGGLLALYLLVYLSVEVAILVAAIVTLRASRLQDVHGRTLKLVGGMVMIALAIVILVDPTIMEQLLGSLVVIVVAVSASVLVFIGDKMWRSMKKKAAAREAAETDAPVEAEEESTKGHEVA